MEGPLSPRVLGFAAAGALLWLQYYDLKDARRPEPKARLVLAFLLGVGAGALALAVYAAAPALGLPGTVPADRGGALRCCFLLVGPLEEGAKFLLARAIVFRWRTFDERMDGLVYAAAVALGFAAFENVFYLSYLPWRHQLVRSLVSPLVHSLFAAIWGFGVAHARFDARSRAGRLAWQAIPLALAAALHGAYDWVLLAHQASYSAAVIVLALWLAVLAWTRRTLRADDAARSAQGPPSSHA